MSTPEAEQKSGRDIITAYLQGDPAGEQAYKKICVALESITRWSVEHRAKFLEQLLDIGDLLNDQCRTLATSICNLSWELIPEDTLPRFQQLLCNLALRHVSNTPRVIQACVRYFVPIVRLNAEAGEYVGLDDKLQEKFFIVAHSILAQLFRCLPMTTKLAAKCLREKFPFHVVQQECYIGYMKNMILVGEYAPVMRSDIWDCIIENLVQLDTFISKEENDDLSNSSSGIFFMDEDLQAERESKENGEGQWRTRVAQRIQKMNEAMKVVFDYISVKMGKEVNDATWLRIGEPCEDMFGLFSECMDAHLLMAVDVHYVPFIWLHLCSLDSTYPARLLDWLWEHITRPQRAPSDAKKSHGAAAYLAAFLARATYIGIDVSFEWMQKMCDRLVSYSDQCGLSQTTIIPGVARHGTFYALSQAFFIVFLFRYRRIVAQTEKWEQLKGWSIARIIHSPLDPLRFVSRPVALCFATISRNLQFVYCNLYLQGRAADEKPRPFDAIFPLDLNTYHLTLTRSVINELMRKFSPLAEDAVLLKEELVRDGEKKKGEEMEGVQEMAFLDEEEEMIVGSFRERTNTFNAQSNLFTAFYSTSPGLKTFDGASCAMDMR